MHTKQHISDSDPSRTVKQHRVVTAGIQYSTSCVQLKDSSSLTTFSVVQSVFQNYYDPAAGGVVILVRKPRLAEVNWTKDNPPGGRDKGVEMQLMPLLVE